MSEEQQIPDYAKDGYKHTEEDFLSIEGNTIEDFLPHSELKFPVHLETKKDTCWERVEETGKFYRISKELYYIEGNTRIRQDRYNPEDKSGLDIEEQYSLIFGNLSQRQTLSSLHFYMTQRQKVAFRIITEEQFQEKLSMISKDFDEFINKSYKNLKTKEDERSRLKQEERGDNETPF